MAANDNEPVARVYDTLLGDRERRAALRRVISGFTLAVSGGFMFNGVYIAGLPALISAYTFLAPANDN